MDNQTEFRIHLTPSNSALAVQIAEAEGLAYEISPDGLKMTIHETLYRVDLLLHQLYITD